MRRLLIDYTDILELDKDVSHGVGLIILKEMNYLDIAQKDKVIIKSRGTELKQHLTVKSMLDSGETKDTYAFNESNQVVFAVPLDTIKTFCSAGAYVTGLEMLYPMKEITYQTSEDNATYDLTAKLSSSGEILHMGDNMSFSEIGNVIKILDNKINLNTFGFDIFEIQRSLEIKK